MPQRTKKMCRENNDLADKDSGFKKKSIPIKAKRLRMKSSCSDSSEENESSNNEPSCEVPDSLFEPLMRTTLKSEPKHEYTCKYCQKVLVNSVGLTWHMEKVHNVLRTFPCDKCGLELPSWAVLERHIARDHKEKVEQKEPQLECPHCHKMFERQSNLVNHVKHMHKKEKCEKYSCLGCGLAFNSASQLTVHSLFEQKLVKVPCQCCQVETEIKLNCAMKKSFNDSGTKVKCKECTENCKDSQVCKQNDPSFSCEECDQVFDKEFKLKYHVKRIHQNCREVCEDCGAEFSRKSSLKRHKMFVHGNMERKLRCSICPASFKVESLLKKHVERHGVFEQNIQWNC